MTVVDVGSVVWVLVVVFIVAVIVIVWTWWRQQPKPDVYGANPDPARITDAMWWLWQQLQALEPSSKLGGIYANKPGYHNARHNLPLWDYSVCDDPPDQGGPGDKAAAIDWTFPDAQSGDYSTIALYTKRLLLSAQDPDDPRLNGWREFFGNADDDAYVEGWDCRYGCASTSDPSHLWHIHASENRDQTESMANKEAFLSVVRGETVDQWRYGVAWTGRGDGSVLLQCPFDADRLDLFYVDVNGGVRHAWWPSGGLAAMWHGPGNREALGGGIVVGTLSASWLPDDSGINVVGLGAPDEIDCPPTCGNYWGCTIYRNGGKSGWGSIVGAYGLYPGAQRPWVT
jgi:hypothetical protein